MRPKTPNNAKNQKKQPKKRASSAVRRKKEDEDRDGLNKFNSSDIDFYISEQAKPKQKEKLYICESAKKIAMIHAYQPKMLKQCLVSNPYSYKKFYNQSEGLSMVSNLYTVSFMAHFREWKKSLRNKLFKIIALVIKLEIPASVNQTQQIVKQLQMFTDELKFETNIVSKQKQVKLSNEASDLNKKFGQFRQYAEQLLQILNKFCSSVKQMSIIVQHVNNESKNIITAKHEIEKIGKQFQKAIQQSIYYCSTHTDSEFMNKAEYRILERFLSITQSYLRFLDNIAILQSFKQKLQALKNKSNKSDQFTLEELEQIGQFINQKESIDLKINKIDSQNKSSFKTQQTKQKLKNSIDVLVKQYLKQLQDTCLLIILQKQCGFIKQETFIKSLSDKGAKFLLLKKKLLRLTKIFTKNNSPQIYQMLSQLLKQSSQNFQAIPQIIQRIAERLQNKKKYSDADSTQQIKTVKNLINKFEESRDAIWKQISKVIKNLGRRDFHQQIIPTKDSLNFDNVIMKSNKKEMQFIPIFELPLDKQKKAVDALDSNIQHIESIMKDRLPSIKKILTEPSNVQNNETVAMFLVLTPVDNSDSQKVISAIQILNELYNNVHELSQSNISPDDLLSTLISCYQSAVSKLGDAADKSKLVDFIQWMIQQVIFKYLHNKMTETYQIIAKQLSWQRKMISDNQHIKIVKSKEMINQFIANKRKNPVLIKPKSLYQNHLDNTIAKIDQFLIKKNLYEPYFNSIETQNLWILIKPLWEWSNQQFQYCVHHSNPQLVNKHRKEIKESIEKKVVKLENIIQDKEKTKVSQKFVDECKGKIDKMSKLLPFTKTIAIVNTQSQQKNKKFIQLMRQILTYLRSNQIFHVGIFCLNSDPFLFLCDQKQQGNFKTYLNETQKKLKISSSQSDLYVEDRFIPFDLIEDSKTLKRSFYYKIKDISSLETLTNCMKAINLEPEQIKKKLNYAKLSQLFEEGGPSQELKTHLNEILNQLKKTNISHIFSGKNDKPPKVQQDLQNLIKSLSKSTRAEEAKDKRINCLAQLLQELGYSVKNILDNKGTGNRIYLCDYGDNGKYAYAILAEKDPAKGKFSFNDEIAIKIQKLFLKCLFGVPYVKNKNLDQIKQQIAKVINSGSGWASYLLEYEKHRLENKADVKTKIQRYIKDNQIKIEITSPKIISLQSYRTFLSQCSKFFEEHHPQQPLFKGVIDNNQKEMICCSQDKNSVSKLMLPQNSSSGYLILPKNFNNAYIERSSNLNISIRLQELVQNIVKQIKNIQQFNPADLLISLSSVEALNRLKKRIEKESSIKLAKEDHIDTVLNTLRALGKDDPISKKAVESQDRLVRAQKLMNVLKQSPFIIDKLNVQLEDHTNFMQISDQHHSSFQNKFDIKFSSTALEKAHEYLNENRVKHKVFRYLGTLIEITAPQIKTQTTLSKLFCVNDLSCLKYEENNLEISIEDITFEVELADQKEFNDQEIKSLERYQVGIKSNNAKAFTRQVKDIINKPIKVSCRYPRNPVEFTLLHTNDEKQVEICMSKVVAEYHYGCKYSLKTLQNQLVKICQLQKQRIARVKQAMKQAEEALKQKQGVNQRADVLRGLMPDNLYELFMDEQCICDISFTFSSGPDVDRDEIIANNSQYRFHDYDSYDS